MESLIETNDFIYSFPLSPLEISLLINEMKSSLNLSLINGLAPFDNKSFMCSILPEYSAFINGVLLVNLVYLDWLCSQLKSLMSQYS